MAHENLASDLINIKSYSGEEVVVREFTKGWLEKRGMTAFEQDGNLVVHLQGKDRSRSFIFNSHMDTVSEGDLPWQFGPWTATQVGDKLIGLGASDMKSGMAASLLLAEKMARAGTPPVDMWFTYVVNEEVDGSGTENFAKWFRQSGHTKSYQDMAAIFTEPTGLIEIEHGHRGNIFLKVETKGDSGHSSRPGELKTHSVREMVAFADRLQQEMAKWSEEYKSDIFTPPTNGEMTSIFAGVRVQAETGEIVAASPNKFPSICTATFDIRTTPDFHPVALAKIQALGEKLGAKVDTNASPAPAGYTDPSERIVQISKKMLGNPKLTVSQGSADLGFLTTEGIKAVIFGPGEKDEAHKVNEFCYPEKIDQAVGIYSQVVEAWSS